MYQPKVDVIKLNWKKEKEDGKPGALAALSGAAVRCSVPCSEQSTLTLARLPSSLPPAQRMGPCLRLGFQVWLRAQALSGETHILVRSSYTGCWLEILSDREQLSHSGHGPFDFFSSPKTHGIWWGEVDKLC